MSTRGQKKHVQLIPFDDCDSDLLISWVPSAEFNMLWGGPCYQWPLTREQILQHHRDPAIHPFMLIVNQQKTGFIELFQRAEYEVRLCRILIGPNSSRGQGLGRRLIQMAVDLGRRLLHAEVISLAVFEHNLAALNCYQAEGFQIIGRDAEVRQFNGKPWPLIHMEKQLGGKRV